MKTRLHALGLVDRALRATTDDELAARVEALGEDHQEALARLVGTESLDAVTPAAIRASAVAGRMNGTLESVAMVLTDAALADCIDQLGDHSDDPTAEQLREVLPGIVERHGVALTRLMLASTVAGEAKAAGIIRDLLKNEDLVKLPKEEPRRIVPAVERTPAGPDPEREALKARRLEARRRKQHDAATRREQSARDRGH